MGITTHYQWKCDRCSRYMEDTFIDEDYGYQLLDIYEWSQVNVGVPGVSYRFVYYCPSCQRTTKQKELNDKK